MESIALRPSKVRLVQPQSPLDSLLKNSGVQRKSCLGTPKTQKTALKAGIRSSDATEYDRRMRLATFLATADSCAKTAARALFGWLRHPGPLLAMGVAAALAVRYPLLSFETSDLHDFRLWHDFILANGYFSALGERFSNYPPAYLYVLAATAKFLPWLPTVFAIKSAHIAADFALAFFVCKCVAVAHPRSAAMPALAFVATLLAPTVVLNSAMWGQCDAIFTSFLVASLHCLLVGRQGWACAAFGMALAFKPLAIFLAPLFLWLLANKAMDWRCFLLTPAVVLASFVPAWLLGMPLAGPLLWSYGHVIAWSFQLTMNAPNLYVWIAGPMGDEYGPWVHGAGVLLAAALVVAVAWVARRARGALAGRGEPVVLLATFSVLLLPYVLTRMHDRYFFAADVFAIVLAFFRPAAYAYVPLVVGSVSLAAYFPVLFDGWPVPPELLAAVLLAVLVALGLQCSRTLATFRGQAPSQS